MPIDIFDSPLEELFPAPLPGGGGGGGAPTPGPGGGGGGGGGGMAGAGGGGGGGVTTVLDGPEAPAAPDPVPVTILSINALRLLCY